MLSLSRRTTDADLDRLPGRIRFTAANAETAGLRAGIKLRIKAGVVCVAAMMACAAAHATTYYVSNSGNDSSVGTSISAPWKTIAKVNSFSFSAGDEILFAAGGTWREQLQPNASNLSFGAYGTGARPVITGSNVLTSGWTQSQTNVWVYSLGAYKPTAVWFNGALGRKASAISGLTGPGAWFFSSRKLYVYSSSDPGTAYTSPGVEVTQRDFALNLQKSGSVTFTHLSFLNGTYASIYLASNLAGTQIFNDVVFAGSAYSGFYADGGSPVINNSEGLYNATGLTMDGGNGFTLNNSILSGNSVDALEVYGTSGQSVITGSTLTGNSTGDATDTTVNNWGTYPLKVSNSILLPNPMDPAQHGYVGITDDGTNTFQSPLFTSRAAPLIVVPFIDDYNNLGVAEAVASTATQYGCHLSYALNTKLVTPADWQRISTLQLAGNEIVAHTRSHADMANNNVFSIQYTGAAPSATMTIDTTNNVLQTFVNGSSTPDLNIPLMDKYNYMGNLCAQVTANSNYTCSIEPNQTFFTPMILAGVSGVDIKSGYMAQAASNYLTWEMDGSKSDIEANLPGYTVQSFATPFTSSNLNVENHALSVGFLGQRNGTFDNALKSQDNWLLANIDLFNLAAEWLPNSYDASQQASSLGAAVEGLGATGGVVAVYAHGYDEFTLAQWQSLFQELQRIGGTCMTMSQAVSYIRSHGTMLQDGRNKNWVELIKPTPDFTNTSQSPSQGAHGLQ